MDAIPLALREDDLGRFRQTVCLLSPAQVIRYVNDRYAEVIGDALEGSMRAHVPFGSVKVVLEVLPRREISLVSFECLDHRRSCLGWNIRVLRQLPDAAIRVSVVVFPVPPHA